MDWYNGLPGEARQLIETGSLPVTIEGHASTTQPGPANRELSRRRADRVNAALPLLRALSGLSRQGRNPGLKNAVVEMAESIQSGSTFAWARGQHPRVFNRLSLNMVKAGAVAGVVNFITRKRVSGFEANVRYGFADDYHAFNAGGIFGHEWSSGSFVAAYQYAENSNITGADRRDRSRDWRAGGGVDTRWAVCPNANVNLVTGTIYAAPSLAPGLNTCDPRGPVDLVPEKRTHSVFVSARQELSSNITLWGDLLYSDREDVVQAALPGQTFVPLTAANPFFRAPPGTGALFEFIDFRPDNLVGADHFDQTFRVRTGNATAGIDVKLPGNFKASLYGTYNWSRNDTFLSLIHISEPTRPY